MELPTLILNLPPLSQRVISKLLINQLLRDHKVSRGRSEALEDCFPSLMETSLRGISRVTVKLIPSSSNNTEHIPNREHIPNSNMGMANSLCISNSLCINNNLCISNSPCMLNGLRGQGWVLAEL